MQIWYHIGIEILGGCDKNFPPAVDSLSICKPFEFGHTNDIILMLNGKLR